MPFPGHPSACHPPLLHILCMHCKLFGLTHFTQCIQYTAVCIQQDRRGMDFLFIFYHQNKEEEEIKKSLPKKTFLQNFFLRALFIFCSGFHLPYCLLWQFPVISLIFPASVPVISLTYVVSSYQFDLYCQFPVFSPTFSANSCIFQFPVIYLTFFANFLYFL